MQRIEFVNVNGVVIPSMCTLPETQAGYFPWPDGAPWPQHGLYGAPVSHDLYKDMIGISCSSGIVPEFRHRHHGVLCSEGQIQSAYQDYTNPSAWQCQPDNFLQLPQGHQGMSENLGGVIGPQEHGKTCTGIFCLVSGYLFMCVVFCCYF